MAIDVGVIAHLSAINFPDLLPQSGYFRSDLLTAHLPFLRLGIDWHAGRCIILDLNSPLCCGNDS
ncbi:MAG: hypothetical protein KME42_12770 [Tildeniella nuda ZEHNDER 1965/U140]|nr:hypothetical protein [Tildeniella nuda ZEHNDER 1965/U140]